MILESLHTRRLLMFGQIALQRERLPTSSTHIWLLRRMRLRMRAQIGFIGKCLITQCTTKRLLSRVRPNMTLQQPRATESLTTIRACASLVMRAHVHTESGHADVDLVTMRTLARLFVCNVTVDLFVTRKVARCAVLFATYIACVNIAHAQSVKYFVNEIVEAIEVDIWW